MRVSYRTDVGLKRQMNQDAVGVFSNQQHCQLAVVCDGVGGHKGGDVASKIVVGQLKAAWEKTRFDSVESVSEWLISSLERINQEVYQRANQFQDLNGMATTVVCAVVFMGTIIIVHVGDSRAYIIRQFILKQLTEDHSLINDLKRKQVITEAEAPTHPMRHVVTRSIGAEATVAIDLTRLPYRDGDIILLCSDGLTDMVSDETMTRYFSEWHSLSERTTYLVDLANKNGGHDNITVLLMADEGEDNLHD